jgi:tetratricopeptide (TPR) repeat protein
MKMTPTKHWQIRILVLMSIVLLLPRLVAAGLENRAAVASVRIVLNRGTPGAYSVRCAITSEEAVWLKQIYNWALSLNPDNTAARWWSARVALASGEYRIAAETLQALAVGEIRNPLMYLDMLDALSYSGESEHVISFYETSPPPQYVRAISDTVVLAHLDCEDFQDALVLHPGDLYASYHLWREARDVDDIHAMHTYNQAMIYFPLAAIDIDDERLLRYNVGLIPRLLEEGVWSFDKTLDVVSYLVWQRHQSPEVARLLEAMCERYPSDPDWLFYLGELYHRQGALGRAKTTYRQVLAADPGYKQVYLRLGMVAEATSQELLGEAARWYEQYYEIAPDDLLGLRKLVEAYEVLGRPEVVALREELQAKTDDQRIVAEMLGVSVEDVELGPNLVKNGEFESWVRGSPEWWGWSDMFNREPFNAAAFVGEADELLSFEGQQAARVDGLWIQQREEKSPARAGFWQYDEVALAANAPYLLSFYYRTSRIPDDMATTWVSGNPNVFWAHDYGLPATQGMWYHFVAVGWNRLDADAPIRPLLRSFATGHVTFDDAQLRLIRLPEEAPVEVGEARFRVIGRDN